jgi:hypothetical protein
VTLAETIIDGFTVSIEPNEDRPGFNCWVAKGRASSSLAVVEDFGAISPDEAGEVKVPQATIDRIRAFAEANGY